MEKKSSRSMVAMCIIMSIVTTVLIVCMAVLGANGRIPNHRVYIIIGVVALLGYTASVLYWINRKPL